MQRCQYHTKWPFFFHCPGVKNKSFDTNSYAYCMILELDYAKLQGWRGTREG